MVNTFLEELDANFETEDIDGAKECIDRWYIKAVEENMWQLAVTVLNEKMGLYRSIGEETNAFSAVEDMLKLVEKYNLYDNPDIGTVWINIGTTLCRFYKHKDGLIYYQKAEKALENSKDPYVLASLYNNSASAYEACGEADRAIENYKKSLELLVILPDTTTFMAITFANMTNCYLKMNNLEEAKLCIARMDSILEDTAVKRNSSYASACKKCAIIHHNIGNKERADELIARAEDIFGAEGEE